MKAQFKYAFRAGLSVRAVVFAVIVLLELALFFAIKMLNSNFVLPIIAVTISGIAIGVMVTVNIVSDILVMRRMIATPDAYLIALIPVPRWKTLLANVVAMSVMDVITTTVVILGVITMAFSLTGPLSNEVFREMLGSASGGPAALLLSAFFTIASYLSVLTTVLFAVTARSSILYNQQFRTPITVLLALAIRFIISLTPLLLLPFGKLVRFGLLFNITLSNIGSAFYIILLFGEAVLLFSLTAWLMERKINI
ncbi:MAG: hypothetical protein FWH40_07950 [Coriobacteriia bacterium]|nr:hypothetical protein [Coriobacteriia bacterium]MCL2137429.1 hypothetical protein [Coriobacteriia bacterium]